jgi:hypothetical protein
VLRRESLAHKGYSAEGKVDAVAAVDFLVENQVGAVKLGAADDVGGVAAGEDGRGDGEGGKDEEVGDTMVEAE